MIVYFSCSNLQLIALELVCGEDFGWALTWWAIILNSALAQVIFDCPGLCSRVFVEPCFNQQQ